MPKFRTSSLPRKSSVVRLVLVVFYACSTFFVTGTSRSFISVVCATYAAGALWGVLRFVAIRTSPVRYVAPVLWGLITCRLIAPEGMRLLLIPRSTLPTMFSDAIAEFVAAASTSGPLNLSTPVRGVVLALVLAAGAIAATDTLVHRSLYRPFIVPVILTALLAYRDGAVSTIASVLAISIAAALLFMDGDHFHALKMRNLRRELPAAVLSGCLIILVSHTIGAAAVQRVFVEPVKQEIKQRVDKQDSRTLTRVSFDNMEDAKKWVEQHMVDSQPVPGNVSDVLSAAAGSPSQLEAVAASLASAGGVNVEIRSDGSLKYSLPKPGETPDVVVSQEEAENASTAPENSKQDTTSSVATASVPSTTPSDTSSSNEEGAAPGPAPQNTTTSTTAPVAPAPSTSDTQPPRTSTSTSPAFLLLGLLVLSALGAGLVLRRRAIQRKAAAASGRGRVLAAWYAADKALSKRTGVARELNETFRERTVILGEVLEDSEEAFKALSELADQAAFGNVEPDPVTAEGLASTITTNKRRHR